MKKVFVRYNQLSHLDPAYQAQVRDLSDFYQQLPYDHNYVILDSTDLDQTFNSEIPADTDWVVVVSLGHCTQNRSLYDECIQACKDLGVEFLAHILNFADQYPHIHPQLFVINYQTWVKLKRPCWNYSGEPQTFESARCAASPENFHDEYTPLWIHGHSSQQYRVREMQTGAQVIRQFLEHGLTVHNIPAEQRAHKWHLYPDQESESFGAFLSGRPYTGNNDAQKHYASLVGHLANQVQRQYYVLNTEALTTVPAGQPITHYAGVASGLKLFCTMIKNGFSSDTSVTIFDFSDVALKFQQHLIRHWDGGFSTYQQVCEDFADSNPGHYPCVPSGDWSDTYNHILTELDINAEMFQAAWDSFCVIDHEFVKINLYDAQDQQQLATLCADHQRSYVWVSNAFYMEYSLITQGKPKLHAIRQGFLDALNQTQAQIVLDVNDFWHQGLITFGQ
jgi:hypothetical protein